MNQRRSPLIEFLQRKITESGLSVRAFAADWELSRTSVQHILDGRTKVPDLPTLDKIAEHSGLPLWRIIEMAGFDLDLDQRIDSTERRLAALIAADPAARHIVEVMQTQSPADYRAILAYIAMMDRMRVERPGTATPPE